MERFERSEDETDLPKLGDPYPGDTYTRCVRVGELKQVSQDLYEVEMEYSAL